MNMTYRHIETQYQNRTNRMITSKVIGLEIADKKICAQSYFAVMEKFRFTMCSYVKKKKSHSHGYQYIAGVHNT